MIVLLDTDLLDAAERADALNAVYNRESPQHVAFHNAPRVRQRTELFEFGPGTHVLRSAGTGIEIARTDRHVRLDAPEAFVIGFQRHGDAQVTLGDSITVTPAGHLVGVDVTRPYTYRQLGPTVHESLIIANTELGVPIDVLRAAAPVLSRSPIYNLLRGHLAHLLTSTAALDTGPRLLTGQATTALVRALVTTAAQSAGASEAMDDTLLTRVIYYINAHLDDTTLNAERIAAAHHISLRHLYNVWSRSAETRSLGQWIIERRLQIGRDKLAASRTQTVSEIARECGFADASHFSRRFRELFGATPIEWRAIAAGTPRR